MLFMGLYLVTNSLGLGAEKTILQVCFFGLFFMIMFQAAIIARNPSARRDWDNQLKEPIDVYEVNNQGKATRKRLTPGSTEWRRKEAQIQRNHRDRNLRMAQTRGSRSR